MTQPALTRMKRQGSDQHKTQGFYKNTDAIFSVACGWGRLGGAGQLGGGEGGQWGVQLRFLVCSHALGFTSGLMTSVIQWQPFTY